MIRTIIFALLTLTFSFLLNRSFNIGDTAIPPLGSFMSPYHGFWQNAEKIGVLQNADISDLELKGEVKVVYDERMIPHVFGEDLSDVLFVQGYLHAKNRLWQMDISTRSAAGRISEVLGDKSLEYDKRKRRMGMPLAAANSLKGWAKFPETYNLLNRYVAGVNAYVENLDPKDYPLEFKLLNYAPEKWTMLHSALFQKNMAFTLCSGYADIENTNMLRLFGPEVFDYLYPEWNPKQSPIIPRTVTWDFDADDISGELKSEVENALGYLNKMPKSSLEKGIGSNNWAVSGSKTKSGNPILCGDPHLQLTFPSIWYEMHINVRDDINSYGVSLPGIPGIIIGFNDHIAWSETNVGHDVWDFYNMDWIDAEKTKYRLDGLEKEVTYRIEEIKTKNGDVIIDTLKMTELGIVAKYEGAEEYTDLVFDWLPIHVPDKDEMRTFLGLNRARNYQEFSKALKHYIAPAQNFAFASVDGDIGLTVNGDLPIKSEQAGRFISDGSVSGGNWKGFIPRDRIPKVLNPERAFISSANQYSTGPEYPYYYNGNGYFEQYRGRILNEKLAQMSNITPDDMMALQYDTESLKARELVPILLKYATSGGDEFADLVLKSISEWDYYYRSESVAASYFEEWSRQLYRETFDELYSLEDTMEVQFPASWVLIRMLEEDAESIFFDILSTGDKIEKASDIVQLSFNNALEKLSELKEKNSLEWYQYQKKSINHLAGIELLSKKNIKANGHGDALNAYGSTAGPSWRMVVSMDSPITAKVVYPGGQSGNPGSPYYDDMVDAWINGQYYDAHFTKDAGALEPFTISTQIFK